MVLLKNSLFVPLYWEPESSPSTKKICTWNGCLHNGWFLLRSSRIHKWRQYCCGLFSQLDKSWIVWRWITGCHYKNVLTVLKVQMNEKKSFSKINYFVIFIFRKHRIYDLVQNILSFFSSCPKNYPYTKITKNRPFHIEGVNNKFFLMS